VARSSEPEATMATIGIELCDAGFLTASCDGDDPQLVPVPDRIGSTEWPGFCFHDGKEFTFGRAAEDMWFVRPRRVAHTFWSRLAHEPSALIVGTKPPSFSELAFYFLREFSPQLAVAARPLKQVVLAVPGAYLKDAATTEERIGLLLGMASELELPLAGLVDMAVAALCDPRGAGFNPSLPVLVVDLHLEGADLTFLTTEERLERRDFTHLPQSGFADLLKHLTGTMGNRFLRHTSFDILEDGKIEQLFFRQTKDFLLGDATEHRFHINTVSRGYEMVVNREQLAVDTHAFVSGLVQGVQTFVHSSPHVTEPCTLALTHRTSCLPEINERLRAAGFGRFLHLPPGAAAAGAARLGARCLRVPEDLADVPLVIEAALEETHQTAATAWSARLQKPQRSGARLVPTHAILDGVGHFIGRRGRFTIGPAHLGHDLVLPEGFEAVDDCAVPLLHEGGRLWFEDIADTLPEGGDARPRMVVEAGDRLTVRSGEVAVEILFAHCSGANGGADRT
jgi:hypothetical protein